MVEIAHYNSSTDIPLPNVLLNPLKDKGNVDASAIQASTPISNARKQDQKLSKSTVDLFSDLSEQLTQSYSLLEHRVADLTSELHDVSEQRIKELKGKEQVANRLEQLINFLPGGVIVLDQRGVIVDVNPAAEDMLEPLLKGQLWRDVISHCFAPKSDDGHEVSNNKGQRINIATRSLGEDGQIILLTDQTETRHLQAQLSRHERLTALGKMMSTLAHQVRTPLSSAMLYSNHLLNESLPENTRTEFTQKILNRLHDMERQVRDMLLFVKAEMPLNDQLTIGDLESLLKESTEMIFEQYEVGCQWLIADSNRTMHCNKDALTGAILNLINNSLQAMDTKGQLHIAIYAGCDHEKNILKIDIVDNGSGIDDSVKTQVNDLFFTTKSQGTGIGLSVVNTMAKAHNGGVFILQNNVPIGATASLHLPILVNI
ncbi:sensor histidine kinase [Eionea flava]